jgi:hypothetical protein
VGETLDTAGLARARNVPVTVRFATGRVYEFAWMSTTNDPELDTSTGTMDLEMSGSRGEEIN